MPGRSGTQPRSPQEGAWLMWLCSESSQIQRLYAFVTLLLPLPGTKSSGGKERQPQEQEQMGAGKRKLVEGEVEGGGGKEEAGEARGAPLRGGQSSRTKEDADQDAEGIVGAHAMKQGERTCYGYNMGTCKAKDVKCTKGLRICMRCWKNGPADSGSGRRPHPDPVECTDSFFAARHSSDRQSKNVGGEVPQTFELFAG